MSTTTRRAKKGMIRTTPARQKLERIADTGTTDDDARDHRVSRGLVMLEVRVGGDGGGFDGTGDL